MSEIIKEVKDFVKKECEKPTSKYGLEPFEFHFIPMVEYAKKIAKELEKDEELIEIAAWLHDIGSIVHGRKDHHITGAKIAEDKLKELGYNADKTELIKKCILHHRGSQALKRESIEEQIIAEADAISNFENIGGIFKAAFVYENLTQGQAKESVKNKLKRKYNQLQFEKSKQLIKPKFDAAMLLLE